MLYHFDAHCKFTNQHSLVHLQAFHGPPRIQIKSVNFLRYIRSFFPKEGKCTYTTENLPTRTQNLETVVHKLHERGVEIEPVSPELRVRHGLELVADVARGEQTPAGKEPGRFNTHDGLPGALVLGWKILVASLHMHMVVGTHSHDDGPVRSHYACHTCRSSATDS